MRPHSLLKVLEDDARLGDVSNLDPSATDALIKYVYWLEDGVIGRNGVALSDAVDQIKQGEAE